MSDVSDVQDLTNRLNDEIQLLFIPGILTQFALKELIKKSKGLLKSKNIIISNPSHLLVGSNPIS